MIFTVCYHILAKVWHPVYIASLECLQCFDTVGWVPGRASGLYRNWVMRCWCGYLSGARCRLLAFSLADATASFNPAILLHHFKFRLILLFWYRLTHVFLEKRPLNGCSSSSNYCILDKCWIDWMITHCIYRLYCVVAMECAGHIWAVLCGSQRL